MTANPAAHADSKSHTPKTPLPAADALIAKPVAEERTARTEATPIASPQAIATMAAKPQTEAITSMQPVDSTFQSMARLQGEALAAWMRCAVASWKGSADLGQCMLDCQEMYSRALGDLLGMSKAWEGEVDSWGALQAQAFDRIAHACLEQNQTMVDAVNRGMRAPWMPFLALVTDCDRASFRLPQ